jgi:hypothetical protein
MKGPAEPRYERALRTAWTVAGVLACLQVVGFLAVALGRLRYPYDLEWMEGGQLVHSYEILAGRFPYRAPSADHIAFPYQPLYAVIVAGFGAIFGLSLPLARAISIACTLACAALVAGAVGKETGSRRMALLAGAMVLSLYRVTGFWFDLARVDSLFMALLVGGLYAAKYIERPWPACLTSVALMVLAYKTKQLALPFFALVPPLLDAKAPRGRRAAVAFVVIAALALALDFVAEQRASDGWFSFYVNQLPRGQPYLPREFFRFWLVLLGDVPLLVLLARAGVGVARSDGVGDGVRRGSWRARLCDTWTLALLLGLAATLVAWPRPGGAANNLMTTYIPAVVPAFVGLHRLGQRLGDGGRALLGLALAAQFAWLAYDPTKQIPGADDYEAGRRLVEVLRAAPGPVLVPDRPWFAVLAGKAPSYHANSYWEMTFQHRPDLMPEDLRRRLADGYYTLVVDGLDPHVLVNPLKWWPAEMLANYRCDRVLDLPGHGLASMAGGNARGPHVLCTYERAPLNGAPP